jgi:AraC-like DNA-binding protein
MQPFRMAADESATGEVAVRVIGWRMPFPEPVESAAAMGWFCFLYHDPVLVRTDRGSEELPAETAQVVPLGRPLAHRPLGDRLLRSWIRCDGPHLPACLDAAGLVAQRAYRLAPGHEVGEALLALHRACAHPRGCAPGLVRSLVQAWMHIVVRDAGPAHPGGIEAVRRRLEQGYARPQRLDDLAQLAGCSRAQLCRRFRAALGCSPIQYVLRLRLEAAREQLLTTGAGIAEIARACGFADRYHLTRAFAARYGCGPAACRRGGDGGRSF